MCQLLHVFSLSPSWQSCLEGIASLILQRKRIWVSEKPNKFPKIAPPAGATAEPQTQLCSLTAPAETSHGQLEFQHSRRGALRTHAPPMQMEVHQCPLWGSQCRLHGILQRDRLVVTCVLVSREMASSPYSFLHCVQLGLFPALCLDLLKHFSSGFPLPIRLVGFLLSLTGVNQLKGALLCS